MTSLVLAIIFNFTIYRKVIMAEETQISPARQRLAALVSLALWAGVGFAGRAIGYVN
jgi:hypothetical protein